MLKTSVKCPFQLVEKYINQILIGNKQMIYMLIFVTEFHRTRLKN